jgi:cell division initiation protein
MHLSPLDIKNQQFSRSFRGFNPDAVNSFLNLLANELEELIRQNSDNAIRIKGLEEQLENYAKIERSINETLLLAQQTASEVSQNAQKKADVIVKEATLRAEQEAAEVRERIGMLKAEYVSLQSQRDAFFARFKGLLTSQLSLLPALSDDVEEKPDANNIAPAARVLDEPEEAFPVVEEIFDSEK